MKTIDLYSKRKKQQEAENLDVFVYDTLPKPLRVQIVMMWDDAIGDGKDYVGFHGNQVSAVYKFIVETLRREYGVFRLADHYSIDTFRDELRYYFLHGADISNSLDIVEMSFRLIDQHCRNWEHNIGKRAPRILIELNTRLLEHGVGYHYLDGVIIRKDNNLTHTEIVKPALAFLSQQYLSGAQQEFLSAFEHQRSGKNKEALNDCLKAFESTMRAICDKREWTYQSNATAKPLITTVLNNGLVPTFWQSQLTTLSSLLESSVPTGRNKLSGHGQGSVPIDVPDSVVQYMLNMTASCIVYLASAERQLP